MNRSTAPAMYDIREITVTHQLASKSSFGTTPDGEEVFISARLSTNFELEVDDTLPMALVAQHNESTAFKVIRIFEPEDAPAQPALPGLDISVVPTPKVNTEQLIKRFLATTGISTVRQITDELHGDDGDCSTVQTVVTRMHNRGDIARADVFAAGDQGRASSVMYAIDKRSFTVLAE